MQAPVCVDACPDYDLRAGCRRDCAKAPARLSSDPDRFPVEEKIAPLVFELKKLGVFFPCWSCEGHNDPSGKLWKLPRVWFYADSVVHLRLLSDAINDQLRTVLGPSGKRPAYITERVKKTWELGDGWARHATVEVAPTATTNCAAAAKSSKTAALPKMRSSETLY